MKYRKKPVIIEAITFDEFVEYGKANGGTIVNNMPWSFQYKGHSISHENDNCYLINTLEGTMKFTPKDMLITGVNGEVYPCKIDIFEATYEKVMKETNVIQMSKSEITKLKEENENLKKCIDMLSPKVESNYLNNLSASIHEDNVKAGWWTDLATGLKKERNVGELLCLVHSEVSEALEGYRKDLMDDKLPHRKAFEVEFADALIRIFDIAGAFNLDLDGSIAEKRAYNAKRDDHKLENRMSANGKKF